MSAWRGYHGRRDGSGQVRDFQRQRAYDWEAHVLNYVTPSCELITCAQLIGRVCRTLGQKPPQLGDGRGCTRGFADTDRIVLIRYHRAPETTLHELAHTLCERAQPETSHGALWMRTYIELLARFLGYDRGFLLRAARSWGLKLASPDDYRRYIVEARHRWCSVAPVATVPLMDGSVVLLGKEPVKVSTNELHSRNERARMRSPERLLRRSNFESAAGLIRIQVQKGWFGAVGTKSRQYALETARLLEKKGEEYGWR